MSTAVKPQEFATAGNYGAGSDDWNGQPRKVIMSLSEKAQGFTPNTPVTAERRNGLHAEHFEANSLVALRAIQEWNTSGYLPYRTTPRDVSFYGLARIGIPALNQDGLVALGYIGSGNGFCFVRSYDGSVWDKEVVDAASTSQPRAYAGASDGEFIANVTGGGSNISHTQFGKIKTSTTALPTDNVAGFHYSRFAANYICLSEGGKFYCGTTMNLMATNTPNVPTGLTAVATSTIGNPSAEFADDGGNNIVAAASCTVSGVSRFRIFYSGDGGATWAVAYTGASGLTSLNVTWCSAAGTFVAIDSLGNVLTSASGAVWSVAFATTAINAAAGASIRPNSFACAGHCIAKIYQPTYYTTYQGIGVAYSFNLGQTWRVQYFGYGFDFTTDYDVTENPQPLLTLISANNRFYATDGARVYRSGLLAFDTTEL